MRITIWLFRYLCASTALSAAWFVAAVFGAPWLSWFPNDDRGAITLVVFSGLHFTVFLFATPRWASDYEPLLGPFFEATPQRVFVAQLALLSAAILLLIAMVVPAVLADNDQGRIRNDVFPVAAPAFVLCWGVLCIVSEGIGLKSLRTTRIDLGLGTGDRNQRDVDKTAEKR